MKNKVFTAGEFAEISHVSSRTIRFYDEKGLLKPVSMTDSGYRLYDEKSMIQLQKIIMLKYLGFSLEKISLMTDENSEELKCSLHDQKRMLCEKRDQLSRLIETIDEAENTQPDLMWDNLVKSLHMLKTADEVVVQYRTDENLQSRINLHDYNTGEPYVNWLNANLDIHEGMNILVIGCGNALNVMRSAELLPRNINILLTDYSEGMLTSAKQNIDLKKEVFEQKNIHISFQHADANDFMVDGVFDLITANHMLYHVVNKKALFEKITSMLSPNGKFCCTTIGAAHNRELHELIKVFNSHIQIPKDSLTTSFQLENAREQLIKYFSSVDRVDHDSDLLVDQAEPVYQYVYSYPGNAAEILGKSKSQFIRMVNEVIEKEGAFYIHKSTGMFICRL